MGDEGRVLTCVYCGMAYPQDIPAWGSQVLTDHIKVCEKHPMRKLEAQKALLRKALIGLLGGAESKMELDNMEVVIRIAQVPDIDKAVSINAIQALRDTMDD